MKPHKGRQNVEVSTLAGRATNTYTDYIEKKETKPTIPYTDDCPNKVGHSGWSDLCMHIHAADEGNCVYKHTDLFLL